MQKRDVEQTASFGDEPGVTASARVPEFRDPAVVGRNRRVAGRARVVENRCPAVVGCDRRDSAGVRIENSENTIVNHHIADNGPYGAPVAELQRA
jgi:hypothetical protein